VNRLEDWVKRLEKWNQQGLKHIHFFVHQNLEKASPLLSAHFIEQMNETIGIDLKIPKIRDDVGQGDLF
jgi:hypothetical protein